MEIIEELLDTAKKQYRAGDYAVTLETLHAAIKLIKAGIDARKNPQ
ncbi:unnamed protein product [marine sediment metagenome]|uniref:Uncharacterized protein n=1 Tax=marine sediment metagenome TaxID=412755 RepID=X1Q2U9_9ZZZZ